jgi:multidrug efflux pump subunit AcrA (membrane-fusion protein)
MPLKMLHKACFLAVLVVMLAACGTSAKGGPTPTPLPPLVNYQAAVYTVEKGSIVSQESVFGNVVPTKQDDLFFRASGFVSRVMVKEGDVVKQGDLLAELQVDDLLNQLEQARIDLSVAQATLDKNITTARHNTIIAQLQVQLAQLDAVDARGKLNLQIAQENLGVAQQTEKSISSDPNSYEQQTVQRNKLSVARLEEQVAERRIVAPYDCIIMKGRLREGQSADAFTAQFTVGDPSQLVVSSARTTDLAQSLTKDSEIMLYPTSDAVDGFKVQYLSDFFLTSNTAASATASTGDNIYFSFPQELSGKLPVGRQVKLVVVLGRKDSVLLLPPAAIRNYRGIDFVIVLDGDKRRRVDLYSIGLKTTERWEVVGELNEGDKVLGP